MRRLGRWALNGLTVLSLLLCVASVVANVATHSPSRWWSYHWRSRAFHHDWRFTSSEGGVYFSWQYLSLWPDGSWGAPLGTLYNTDYSGATPNRLGFGLNRAPTGGRWAPQGAAVFPWWFITCLFALLPAAVTLSRLVRKRPSPTACSKCDYNLTGNVSGVCPECGTWVAKVG